MQYTKEEIDSIINRHQHYLRHDCKSWQNMRADLLRADLSGANLLRADLSDANLLRADLSDANLRGAALSRAALSRANLSEADLSGAALSDANLRDANLRGADLRGADLRGADLRGADLNGADLRGADLNGADLRGAYLDKIEYCRLGRILDKPIIGYKKSSEGTIITAMIPAGAVVFSINNSKCRTNRARIMDMDGAQLLHSQYNYRFEYRLFQDIEIKDFDLMYNIECASGFHFFRTREEAENF